MGRLQAIFFDQDGVIIDTERDGHRVAFNDAFREFGYDFQWDVAEYHKLLQISGGKERMRHYFKEKGLFTELSQDEEDALIKRLHKRKTALFISLIEEGKLPLRVGVKRLMQEAMEKGIRVGVCTTANERSARAITGGMLREIDFEFVLAGDVVSKKKPDPDIYRLALKKTGLDPLSCVVIEDSRNGILAAKSAGIPVVATTNLYTEQEDLSDADIVITSLGDPDGEKGLLKQGDNQSLHFDGIVHMDQLLAYFST
ncbi:MAG: HAD-IA family hydrolase [Deltaproteobacteria bacterium]|nr:HAD-IA family hydrolase [Deltaproteobacteria bacterium]